MRDVLATGHRTSDIALPGDRVIGTRAMGDAYLTSVVSASDGAVLGERGGLLSGGEAQRVRLGRARLGDARACACACACAASR